MNPDLPRLYSEHAAWFHLLTAPSSYVEEAAFARQTLIDAVDGVHEVLKLGSGGGNNAFQFRYAAATPSRLLTLDPEALWFSASGSTPPAPAPSRRKVEPADVQLALQAAGLRRRSIHSVNRSSKTRSALNVPPISPSAAPATKDLSL